jgi:predicted nucleotidyltransferase
MIYKNRNRLNRGVLANFEQLPELHQNNFSLIKKVIKEKFDEEIYVYGSFYWGYWDEYSDYDVCVKYKKIEIPKKELLNIFFNIKNILKTKYDLNVDILMIREDLGVLIP